MHGDQPAGHAEPRVPEKSNQPANADHRKTGLDDPRAVDILTTEHWSLISSRTLGYQEMFGRATVFVSILSGFVVALAFLAQATHFGRATLTFALLLLSVALFIGITTFVRSVAINFEDALWVAGMDLLRRAYVKIVPETAPFFVTGNQGEIEQRSLAHGAPQSLTNLADSLTTTSSVVATLNSVLAGSLAAALVAFFNAGPIGAASIGAIVSIVSGFLHVRYAARYRRTHVPSTR